MLLRRIYQLLEPGGYFSCDLSRPLERAGPGQGLSRLVGEEEGGPRRRIVWETRRFEKATSRCEYRLAVEELAPDGSVELKRYHNFLLCAVDPDELSREVADLDFLVKGLFGDFELHSLKRKSGRQLWLLQKPPFKTSHGAGGAVD